MQRLETFKFELMLADPLERQTRPYAGAGRFIFNLLVLQKTRDEHGDKSAWR